MSENVKPLFDRDSATQPGSSDPLSLDTNLMQAAEARMRRAWGLEGGAARQRAPERQEPVARQPERFVPGHNGHKRRFVQDGEVPVTVVSGRREGAAETVQHRGPSVGAAPSRLEAAENALAQEGALRQQAERALADAQATIHDLQTKLGHADLARIEAVEGLRREQETTATLRAELHQCEERLHEAERAARPRRERAVHRPVVAVAADLADIDEAEPEIEAVAAIPRQPVRRGRPPSKKPAGRSKLVRWWLKDGAKEE